MVAPEPFAVSAKQLVAAAIRISHHAELEPGKAAILVVNTAGDRFLPDRVLAIKDALKAKKSPLSLLVKTGDIYRTVNLDYDGGLRYPKLEKTGSGPSSLDELLAPKP